MQVNIKNLIDEVQYYLTVRGLRWPDGVTCPSCQCTQVIKCGFDDTEPARQRYACTDCHTRFDGLTDTIFAGHQQPLKVRILRLYFMGLNLSKISWSRKTLESNMSDYLYAYTDVKIPVVKAFSLLRGSAGSRDSPDVPGV